MQNAKQEIHTTTPMRLRAWLSLGFVIGALALLVAAPFVTSWRVASIRRRVIDVTNRAEVLESEFEAAFAEEVVDASADSDSLVQSDSDRVLAISLEQATERPLDSLVRLIGGSVMVQLEAVRAAEQQWRALDPPDHLLLSAAARDRRAVAGRQVIHAAERLHNELAALSKTSSDEAHRLMQIDMMVSAGLGIIGLVAMAIVVALARKLERSTELRATLVNGVAHDVKNPLGAAAGYADLLGEGAAGPLNEQQAEMVVRVKRLIGTAQQTVAELVDLARVDAGEYSIDRRDTDLVATLQRIIDDHQSEAAQKSIALSLSPPVDSFWMKTDGNRVRHVVENLLSNALKYTPTGGVVNVALRVADGAKPRACISVRDNGPGVPVRAREHLFDPFYRVPSSEHHVRGSGLGLAISHRIARLLGGDLTVSDTPGGGSDFVLTLPMDRESATDLPGEMVAS